MKLGIIFTILGLLWGCKLNRVEQSGVSAASRSGTCSAPSVGSLTAEDQKAVCIYLAYHDQTFDPMASFNSANSDSEKFAALSYFSHFPRKTPTNFPAQALLDGDEGIAVKSKVLEIHGKANLQGINLGSLNVPENLQMLDSYAFYNEAKNSSIQWSQLLTSDNNPFESPIGASLVEEAAMGFLLAGPSEDARSSAAIVNAFDVLFKIHDEKSARSESILDHADVLGHGPILRHFYGSMTQKLWGVAEKVATQLWTINSRAGEIMAEIPGLIPTGGGLASLISTFNHEAIDFDSNGQMSLRSGYAYTQGADLFDLVINWRLMLDTILTSGGASEADSAQKLGFLMLASSFSNIQLPASQTSLGFSRSDYLGFEESMRTIDRLLASNPFKCPDGESLMVPCTPLQPFVRSLYQPILTSVKNGVVGAVHDSFVFSLVSHYEVLREAIAVDQGANLIATNMMAVAKSPEEENPNSLILADSHIFKNHICSYYQEALGSSVFSENDIRLLGRRYLLNTYLKHFEGNVSALYDLAGRINFETDCDIHVLDRDILFEGIDDMLFDYRGSEYLDSLHKD